MLVCLMLLRVSLIDYLNSVVDWIACLFIACYIYLLLNPNSGTAATDYWRRCRGCGFLFLGVCLLEMFACLLCLLLMFCLYDSLAC
jgi:hypothetical protein